MKVKRNREEYKNLIFFTIHCIFTVFSNKEYIIRPKLNRQHPDLQEAIKNTARKQIKKNGAVSLSLRAIARELEITAPAIYNYFPTKDNLVTTLIVDAYHSLSVSLSDAKDSSPEKNYIDQIIFIANRYRSWALSHSEEYGLIFGTPIPDYKAPMEIINPAAAGGLVVLIGVLDTAYRMGKLTVNKLSVPMQEMMQHRINKTNYQGPPAIIHIALGSWAHIHGLVSLELFGNLSSCSEDTNVEPFFEAEIQILITRIKLK